MTKEITKAIIIQEIQDKFKLRELEPEVFSFGERVVPVYNVERHLEKWLAASATKSITSASYFSFFTVPENQRWSLRRYDIVFMASGAYTVTGAFVTRNGGSNVYLDMTAGQTVSYHIDLINPVALQPGDAFLILIDGYTSTANLQVFIDYLMEEIR